MASLRGVVFISLLFTSIGRFETANVVENQEMTRIMVSSTFSLKRDVAAQTTCREEIAACRQPDEAITRFWFAPMFNSDGSFNVNCSAVENQITCMESLDDSCRRQPHWIEFRNKLTINQHACKQTAVFMSGKECWTAIEMGNVLSECGICDFVDCAERVLPGVPECRDERHVTFFANLSTAIFENYNLEYFHC